MKRINIKVDKTKLKEKAKEPRLNLMQLSIFIILIVYNIVSNSTIFSGNFAIWNIVITIGSYFFIMALKSEMGEGDLSNVFKSIMDIVSNGDTNDTKIDKIENILVYLSRELGEHYGKEIEKFKKYINDK